MRTRGGGRTTSPPTAKLPDAYVPTPKVDVAITIWGADVGGKWDNLANFLEGRTGKNLSDIWTSWKNHRLREVQPAALLERGIDAALARHNLTRDAADGAAAIVEAQALVKRGRATLPVGWTARAPAPTKKEMLLRALTVVRWAAASNSSNWAALEAVFPGQVPQKTMNGLWHRIAGASETTTVGDAAALAYVGFARDDDGVDAAIIEAQALVDRARATLPAGWTGRKKEMLLRALTAVRWAAASNNTNWGTLEAIFPGQVPPRGIYQVWRLSGASETTTVALADAAALAYVGFARDDDGVDAAIIEAQALVDRARATLPAGWTPKATPQDYYHRQAKDAYERQKERQKVLDAEASAQAAERHARYVQQRTAHVLRSILNSSGPLVAYVDPRSRSMLAVACHTTKSLVRQFDRQQYRAAEERKRALIGVKDLAALLDPWSRCMLAAACRGTRRLVERFVNKQKASTATYHSDLAPWRLDRAQLFGCSLWAPETSLPLGGKGLFVTDVESRVTGDAADCVRRVVEMPREFQWAVEGITNEVEGFFSVAERQGVDYDELWGDEMRPHVGRDRAPTWSQNLTDRGQLRCHHADYIDRVEAAQGHRHGREECPPAMVRHLVIAASGFVSARRRYPSSGLWESTVDSYYRIILTPPGSGGSVTHAAHRDNQYCPHTQLVRFPLVTFVFVRYYTLDDDGMLRRASPDLASVSGLLFRELPRGAGPGIFAQIADGGFVMFDAHANAHYTHEVMRAVEPAPGIYRISIVVHLMSLPEQQRFLEVY